jgi:cardiolipin synthase
MCPGNVIRRLHNGDEIFPAMLAAIETARTSICFETYIYWSGTMAERFARILAERARAGVNVCILLDWVGSVPMDRTLIQTLRDAGCDVRRFHRPNWRHPSRLNHRTHRKLLIVDGRIGFTGGVGIADHWQGNAEDKDHWRDTHFEVRGPVIGQIQAAFMVNWIRTTGEVKTGPDFFPPLEPESNGVFAHMFVSSPDEGSENARVAVLLALGAARQRVRLTTPYFIPDKLARQTLIATARRGVTVEVLFTGPETDSQLSRLASRALWGPLLRSGVRIYEYTPTMLHAKSLLIDDHWCSVGSANIDQRSFRLNDESNLQICDTQLNTTLQQDFDQDLKRAKEIDLDTWRNRPWHERCLGQLASLLRSQL